MPLLLSPGACSAAHYLCRDRISQDINTELLRTARLRAADDKRSHGRTSVRTVQKNDTELTARAAHEVFIKFKSDPRIFYEKRNGVDYF